MSDVEEPGDRIPNLPPKDMATSRDWFLEPDEQLWDEQTASDFRAGKFQGLIDGALEELAQESARALKHLTPPGPLDILEFLVMLILYW